MGMLMKRPSVSDILLNEYAAIYNRESLLITNDGEDDIDLDAGVAMDDTVPVVASGETSTDGILLDSHTILAGKSKLCAVLVRGPATCRVGGIVGTDVANAALNTAQIQVALEALGILFREEPSTTSTQTS